MIIGPIIGSFLYSLLGFKHFFFVYGGSQVLLSVIVMLKMPKAKVPDEPDKT